ncbi:SDR family oxidoreductase [Bdellovibrio sp. HCB337]|uniref:SDR family oxidoreductase n=1 Tax=Bdellovibrio sp. HCB337 TaxID=3394358 RepID=UPI0039A70BF0
MIQLWYWFKRRTPQHFQPVILVTGCSSGVGLAIADVLYTQFQYRVIVTARQGSLHILREKFKESDRFLIRPLDVTSNVEREILVKEIEARWGCINILVNNAGISYRAVLEHMTESDEFHQMSTNYLGPVALIRLVMPKMREAGRGKIINVSSVSGMLAMPTMSSYSASKYALEGMSEALWYEARPLGINVSLIQPGFIRSNSFKNVYYTQKSKPDEKGEFTGLYSDYYKNMAPFVEKLMSMSLTNPKAMSDLVLKVIQTENPPLWIPATIDAAVFYYLRRLVPRRLLLPLLFFALPKSHLWNAKYTKRRFR